MDIPAPRSTDDRTDVLRSELHQMPPCNAGRFVRAARNHGWTVQTRHHVPAWAIDEEHYEITLTGPRYVTASGHAPEVMVRWAYYRGMWHALAPLPATAETQAWMDAHCVRLRDARPGVKLRTMPKSSDALALMKAFPGHGLPR